VIEASVPKPSKTTPLRVVLVLLVAAVLAALVWALVIKSGGSSKPAANAKPSAATVAGLEELAGTLKHPIYWAGDKPGYTYELTKTDSGNVYVRYLPKGVQVGDLRADFLTVGTYPDANPMRRLGAALKRKGTIRFNVPDGGTAVQDSAHPTSVYLAYPNSSLLLEVFEPSPAKARAVVKSGVIRPVG
jgi:hypothetical protein